jgi:hypothetical protein
MFYFVFTGIRIIPGIHVDEPVDIGALWFFIQDGIDDLMFDLFGIIGAGQVNQVGVAYLGTDLSLLSSWILGI